jgi:hypothetical protein
MNNIISIYNPDQNCPTNSKDIGNEYAIITEKTMNSSIGKKLQDYDDTKEYRNFKFCEHPMVNASPTIPKNSMFTVRDGKCPNNSITLGKINFFDSIAVNSEVSTNQITTLDGNFLQYAILNPTLCKAETNLPITPNIILPSKNCSLKNWANYGMYAVLAPQRNITTSPFIIDDSNTNFKIDASNSLLPGYYIIQPQLCYGQGNQTVQRCTAKGYGSTISTNKREQQICDEDMKMLCGRKEFQSDPICSCFYSDADTLSNPGCIDEQCNKYGYKTIGQLTTPCLISNVPIDCTSYEQIKQRNPNMQIARNEWTDYCFIEEKIKETKLLPEQITQRSAGNYWFTNPRIYVALILFIIFLTLIYLYYI